MLFPINESNFQSFQQKIWIWTCKCYPSLRMVWSFAWFYSQHNWSTSIICCSEAYKSYPLHSTTMCLFICSKRLVQTTKSSSSFISLSYPPFSHSSVSAFHYHKPFLAIVWTLLHQFTCFPSVSTLGTPALRSCPYSKLERDLCCSVPLRTTCSFEVFLTNSILHRQTLL